MMKDHQFYGSTEYAYQNNVHAEVTGPPGTALSVFQLP